MTPPFKRTRDIVTICGGRTRRFPRLAWKARELWGLNGMFRTRQLPWTRWFNLHRLAHLRRDWRDGLEIEIAWANYLPHVPFYGITPWPWIRHSHAFPLTKIRSLPRGGRYHAGSYDMLVAFAVWLGFKRIELYGIGLNLESGEPVSARACLEYWLGVAAGRGIEVFVHPKCDIFAQYHYVKSRTVYGYDDVRLVEDRT